MLTNLIGIGTISLIIYVVIILIVNTVFKRKMAECMFWAYLVLLGITIFKLPEFSESIKDSLSFALKQQVIYAAMAFTFMAYIMNKTGVIERLVNILNSMLGRLPGGSAYVSTIASALFGMISGSGSGNAAAVGSITIPWMKKTGWSDNMATTIVAGNAGLGIAFPPSSSMFLLLGMPAIAKEITSEQLYITLLSAATILLIYRLILVRFYVKKYNIQAVENHNLNVGTTLKENWKSLLIFLGVIIPVVITSGPVKEYLTASETFGKDALKSVSLILWIPILITFIAMLEGRKFLPKTAKGWWELNKGSYSQYAQTGVLLFFAFAASRLLINLGLEEEVNGIFAILASHSKFVVVLGVAVLSTMMVGPFTGTATTTAIGSIAYLALRSIDVEPAVACSVLLLLFSNEGCIPPNSAPIYIACGISGLENPASTFKNLVFAYAFPAIIFAMLMALGIIPLL